MTKTFALALAAATAASLALSPAQSFAAMPPGASFGASHDGAVVQIAAKKKKMTRREEADRSVRDGTVPARYRRDVPREYHRYIPFAKQ